MFTTYSIAVSNPKNLYSIHQDIHRVFHTADQHEKCPVFKHIVSDMVRVRSASAPVDNLDCVVDTINEAVPTGHMLLKFNFAAIYANNGKTFGYGPKDDDKVIAKITRNLEAKGFTVEQVKYRFSGLAYDSVHNFKFPYGSVSAKVYCYDQKCVEDIMLNGIGKKKYLGMGFVSVEPLLDKSDDATNV